MNEFLLQDIPPHYVFFTNNQQPGAEIEIMISSADGFFMRMISFIQDRAFLFYYDRSLFYYWTQNMYYWSEKIGFSEPFTQHLVINVVNIKTGQQWVKQAHVAHAFILVEVVKLSASGYDIKVQEFENRKLTNKPRLLQHKGKNEITISWS